ncbi:hypothetical protein [Clostridium intestinale]|uniref:hypothetical protein n=1 Tax=Clostridium intestinale TaxID=36845 RepID=UPI0028EA51C9|nr:hypothetical protein [Clostridium intestinale]
MINEITNILNLQAKDIYEGNLELRKDNKKKYKGSMDYSLIAIKLNELGKSIIYKTENKQYTDAIINVNFDYRSEKYTTKELRELLYKDGFYITIGNKKKKFIRFIRSSGSSREGKCLFIEEKHYKKMIDYCYLGLKFKDNEVVDLASLESYIALITSSIINTIKLEPKNFLIIDDAYSKFTDKVMETSVVNKDGIDRLHTEINKNASIENNIWDGQSLLDESVFEENGYEDKSFLLLRNSFFKSCCFNSNVQQFFKDKGITDISQLRGTYFTNNIEDIKIITTPSSLKFIKFGTVEDWVDKVDTMYGVVKYDKPTHFFGGRKVQAHYQLLQTLHLTEEDTRIMLRDSIDYVRLLKTDLSVFREYLGSKIEEDAKVGEVNSTNDFMFTMLSINDDISRTKIFTNFKQDVINAYVKNIKKGHVLIDGNYSTLFGNSWEMLRATIKDKTHELYLDYNNIVPLLKENEIHCTNFKYNQKLLCVRSPHVTMGNLLISINRECKVLDTYFNLSRQVVCVNAVNFNSQQRLNGQDLDSDSMLITPNLVEYAEKYYNKFLVPTSAVKPAKKDRYNTAEEKADLDYITSENLIGEIINCSAVLNGKLWDMVNKGLDVDSEEVQELYKAICTLSILSNLEIDKAKREFSINSKYELNKIRDKYFDKVWVDKRMGKQVRNKAIKSILEEMKELREDEQDIKYLEKKTGIEYGNYQLGSIKPNFFKFLSDEKGFNSNCIYKDFETTMDYLLRIIKKDIKNAKKTKDGITLLQMLNCNDIKISEADRKKVKKIINDVQKLKRETDEIWSGELDNKEKFIKANKLKNEYVEKVTGKIDKATLKKLIYELCRRDDLSNIERKLTTIIFASNKQSFIELFQEKKEKIKYLEMVKRGQDIEGLEIIELYNMQYVVKSI